MELLRRHQDRLVQARRHAELRAGIHGALHLFHGEQRARANGHFRKRLPDAFDGFGGWRRCGRGFPWSSTRQPAGLRPSGTAVSGSSTTAMHSSCCLRKDAAFINGFTKHTRSQQRDSREMKPRIWFSLPTHPRKLSSNNELFRRTHRDSATDPVVLKNWYVRVLGARPVWDNGRTPPSFLIAPAGGAMLEIYPANAAP